MKALENSIKRQIPQDILLDYIKLYKKVGVGEKYIDDLNVDFFVYNKLVQKDDIKYLFDMFFPTAKISETRFTSFVEKKADLKPRNKDEILLVNIRGIFDRIYSSNVFEVNTNEINDLAVLLYKGYLEKNNSFKKSSDSDHSSRDKLEEIVASYNKLRKEKMVDYLCLNIAFLVDFLKLSPFKEGNSLVGIIVFYVLSLESDIKAFAYSSFFKKLFKYKDEYEKSVNESFFMYEDGFPNVSNLLRLMLKIDKEAYDDLESLDRDYLFSKGLKKYDTVINIIYKLGETFSKNDIREAIPGISDSTIDRVLQDLQNEGKIGAYSKGRNAKWVLLDRSRDEKKNFLDEFKK